MKRYRNAFLFSLLLYFIILATITYAQESRSASPSGLEPTFRFSHLTIDDGLAQNSITAILQDRQGFMWIGTENGLSRFDGYTFVTYRHDPDNPHSLRSNNIRDIFEDEQGRIWVAGREGITIFDPITETFTPYPLDVDSPPGSGNLGFFSIFQDRQGNLWFGGPPPANLLKLEPTSQTVTSYIRPGHPEGFQGGGVWQMAQDSTGNLWLAADSALAKFNPQTEQFSYFSPDLGERRLGTLVIDSQENLWVGGALGLYQFNPKTEQFTHYPGPTRINKLLINDTGSIWITSLDGLFVFNPRTKQFTQTHYDPTNPDSLSNDRTTALYQDQGGVVWIGTSSNGLNLFNPRQLRFAHYRHNPNNPASLGQDRVTAIAGDENGQLWLGTGNILNRLDLDTGQITHFQLTGAPDINQLTIHAIQPDLAGYLWLGTSNRRLFRFDPATEQMTPYPLPKLPPSLQRGPPMEVEALAKDHNNTLWIAVIRDGLYQFDPQSNIFHTYRPVTGPNPLNTDPQQPLSTLITALYTDRAGQIWLGYQQGALSRLDPQTEIFTHFRPQSSLGPIEAIYQDQAGLMWLATQEGLISFDPATEKTTRYTDKNGLPTDYVVGILADQVGNLWLSTQKGLSQFDPHELRFRNFDVSDGLQGNEFSSRSAWQASDGRMFFGGTLGLTAFYPQQIEDNSYQPPVVLTELHRFNEPVKIGDGPLLQQPIWGADHLTLSYEDSVISFEFAALSYAIPQKNQYQYKLDGFEDQWNTVGSDRRFATYTALPAGQYTFRVRAANDSGVWSRNEVALSITVLPPWWETTWFRLLALVFIAAVLTGGYWWRFKTIQHQNRLLESQVSRRTSELQQQTQALAQSHAQLEQEIDERKQIEEDLRQAKQAAETANQAKSIFLANMSHELRTPLNAIIGFTQIIVRDPTLPPTQQEYLRIINQSGEHLLALINQVLELSKIEAGRMVLSKTEFDLYQMLADLADMFRLRADDKKIQLIFEHSPDVPRTIRTDQIKLRQVLINLLNNALKFTKAGQITCRVSCVKTPMFGELPHVTDDPQNLDPNRSVTCQLRFAISDTGPGIAPEEKTNLFEAFAQTAAGRKAQEGAGLGLALSRRFVQLLGGGEIMVESPATPQLLQPDPPASISGSGPGTTFTFDIRVEVIPLTPTDQGPTARGPISEMDVRRVSLAPNQPRYRLLIVDDEPVNRRLLRELLAPLGFEMREAENGQQAIEIWQEFSPHLIWMDMRMPVLNGYEATQIIKSRQSNSQHLPSKIIALTASSFEEEKADILAAGCDDFLRKPFRETELFQMMSQHIGVQFIYEGRDESSMAGQMGEPALPPELMASLSLPQLTRLAEAVELSDIMWANQIIDDIRTSQPELAGSLGRLVNNFEYSAILTAIEHVTSSK
ncbi:MAG: response regulator [Anaerolineaceae bacterium]|nr:response regulator [Anaerolineaceae bacterium]MCB9099630.1 response regulator [Anaerolineales bacterium]